MSGSASHQSQAAFQDASTYFSEEEWKLLHNWQKELYRNVMKEIHQALISLGPLIATTVCSLRTKVKEEVCPSDDPCSEKRQIIKVSPSYLLPETDIPVIKEEPVSIFIDHLGAEIEETRIDTNPENYEVVSFCINNEMESNCIDLEDRKTFESPHVSTGDESMKRKRKIQDSVKCSERPPKHNVLSKEINTTDVRLSNEEASSRITTWSQCFQELRVEKTGQYKGSFNNPSPFSSPHGSHSIEGSDKYDECESNLTSAQFSEDHLNTPENQKQTTCSQGDKSYRVRPYACTVCEKSFFHRSNLILHKRIHSGVKPFVCPYCQKGFNRKYYLGEHLRTHTGERPYICANCERTFTQKSHLNEHQRKQSCIKTAKTT